MLLSQQDAKASTAPTLTAPLVTAPPPHLHCILHLSLCPPFFLSLSIYFSFRFLFLSLQHCIHLFLVRSHIRLCNNTRPSNTRIVAIRAEKRLTLRQQAHCALGEGFTLLLAVTCCALQQKNTQVIGHMSNRAQKQRAVYLFASTPTPDICKYIMKLKLRHPPPAASSPPEG